MKISRIEVKNFKVFKDLSIDLNNYNVLIGGNATGKSNFVQIFQFIRDIINNGLGNAISMQGGAEYLCNIQQGLKEPLKMAFYLQNIDRRIQDLFFYHTETNLVIMSIYYEFTLSFKGKNKYQISSEILNLKSEYADKRKSQSYDEIRRFDSKLILKIINGKLDIEEITDFHKKELKNFFSKYELYFERKSNSLLLEARIPFLHEVFIRKLGMLSIYDFKPISVKSGSAITGKETLEEDGSNLSLVIKKLCENQESKKELSYLLNHMLSFINNIGVEQFSDKSVLLKIKEKYYLRKYIPAALLSDGTINIVALVIALHFQPKPFIFIEEPERNIHPHLISRLVEFIKSSSIDNQIVVTTHNPEFVKHSGINDLLLISRDSNGYSTIKKPKDSKEIKKFLDNEIGIGELYIQNLLDL